MSYPFNSIVNGNVEGNENGDILDDLPQNGTNTSLFAIDRVQLMFSLTDIISMVVGNNILCLALKSGRIIRIDLDHPESVDEVDLPKRTSGASDSEIISSIFLDPTGSHLIITNGLGENYYLNYQSVRARPLGRLKGLVITSIAWNPFESSRSTGEILVGCNDGTVYETLIEKSNEYFKKEDRYLRQVWKNPYGESIGGLYAYQEKGVGNRQVIVSSQGKIWFWQGKFGLTSEVNGTGTGGGVSSGSSSINSDILPNSSINSSDNAGIPLYNKFFDSNEPIIEIFEPPGLYDAFAISPFKIGEVRETSSTFASINGVGILHGQFYDKRVDLGGSNSTVRIASNDIFKNCQIVIYDQLQSVLSLNSSIKSLTLTEYFIILLTGSSIICINRLNNQVNYHDKIRLEPGEVLLGLCSDIKYSTFWAYSNQNIYEVKVGDEEHDLWKTLLASEEYEEALKLAKDSVSKDIVSIAYGEYLLREGKNLKKAASLLGSSSKPFESVALEFTVNRDFEPLKVFLMTRLKLYRGGVGSKMQRTMLTSWMVELYMEQLDLLDDLIAAEESKESMVEEREEGKEKEKDILKSKSKSQGLKQLPPTPTPSLSNDLQALLKSFYSFIESHKFDLNKETIYEIISSHGRREELLYYASSISDTSFVLNYWIRFEQWNEALKVLRVENDPKLAYKYSTVLLVNSPQDTVDSWIRMSDLDPTKLIPALLSYINGFRGDSTVNQAIRYLNYAIKTLKTKDSVIYNTLISIYASSVNDEAPLLRFLEDNRNSYDYDFALRICNQFSRIQSSVYIFSAMGLYEEAVKLALKKGDIDLACIIADKPSNDSTLRKSLWLEIAHKVISTTNKTSSAVDILEKCDLLKIEDLLPLFPDVTVMDDLKDEVIASMENYSSNITQLNREMEESLQTGNNIKQEIEKFKKRYALIMPGESCSICDFPVATRRFYVFPCQHAFHLDCLLDSISKTGDQASRSKLAEIQVTVKKTELANAVDGILSEKCILCGEGRIEIVDRPLVSQADKARSEWSL